MVCDGDGGDGGGGGGGSGGSVVLLQACNSVSCETWLQRCAALFSTMRTASDKRFSLRHGHRRRQWRGHGPELRFEIEFELKAAQSPPICFEQTNSMAGSFEVVSHTEA